MDVSIGSKNKTQKVLFISELNYIFAKENEAVK